MSFLKNYITSTIKQAASDATDALVAFDPEGATQAQISQMEEALDKAGALVSKATTKHNEAKAALSAAHVLHDQRMKAAELLNAKIEAGDTSKEASLNTLVNLLEASDAEIKDLARNEADYASDLAALTEAYNAAADRLKGARKVLDDAKRDMERAKLNEAREKERAEAAAAAAGIHKGTNSLNVAVDAMKRKAQAANEAADAARLKASTLAPTKAENDPTIAAALAEVAGNTNGTTLSVKERLAALRQPA